MIGKRFGHLIVLRKTMPQTDEKTNIYVVRCDCGKRKRVLGVLLQNGSYKSCGCKIQNIIDISEHRYGEITAIERLNTQGMGLRGAYWYCYCSCGSSLIASCSSLRKGQVTSCGCKQVDHLEGRRFSYLVAIKRVKHPGTGKSVWSCKCDCGNTHYVQGYLLKNNKVRSCGCMKFTLRLSPNKVNDYNLRPKGESGFNRLLYRYIRSSRKRELDWELPVEQFRFLVQSPCFYCGSNQSCETKIPGQKSAWGTYSYNGIDRLDNGIGYTSDNAVPCCKTCNVAKGKMGLGEFMDWLEAIVAKNRV